MPYFIRVPMLLVDIRNVKAKLMSICIDAIELMSSHMMSYITKRSTEISKQITFFCEATSVIPETTK